MSSASSSAAPTRIAVVGIGAFGKNHLRVWRNLQQSGAPVQIVAAVDPDPTLAAQVSAEYKIPTYQSVRDLIRSPDKPDAATIAAPTAHHAAIAAELLDANPTGIDVLVEKPFTRTLQEADELVQLSERRQRILQVGHLERFNPAVLAVRPLLNRPLFFEAHRLSIFTPRSLDVDVVLDLMIHDLDVVLSFVDSPVRELHAVGLPVLSPKVDIANVRVEFESGCVANFTASRVSTERVRKLRFFQPHQYISIDYARQDVLFVDVAAQQKRNNSVIAAAAKAQFHPAELRHPTPELALRRLDVPPGEPLKLELEAFLRSVRERHPPAVPAREGRAALALALDILAAIAQHHHRAGLT